MTIENENSIKKLKPFEKLDNEYPDYWGLFYGKEIDYDNWLFAFDCNKPVVDLKFYKSEIGQII